MGMDLWVVSYESLSQPAASPVLRSTRQMNQVDVYICYKNYSLGTRHADVQRFKAEKRRVNGFLGRPAKAGLQRFRHQQALNALAFFGGLIAVHNPRLATCCDRKVTLLEGLSKAD